MNNSWLSFCLLLSALSIVFSAGANAAKTSGADGAVLVVSADGISSLAAAVKMAEPGNVILITKGKYIEGPVVIDKRLSVIGEAGVEILHQGQGDAILVTASDVLVKGLKIVGSGKSSYEDFAALKARGVKRCNFVENEIVNAQYGIVVNNSSDCVVAKNVIKTNSEPADLSGDGIHLWKTTGVSVAENTVQGHRDGIYLEFAEGGTIVKNDIKENSRYGLHFMFSNENEFRENFFVKNDAGVAVMYSKKIHMVENQFSENKGPASFGLLLKDISESNIENNRFEDNTVGIFMEGSNRNKFFANRFDRNGWALRLLSSCDSNEFLMNSFLDNSLEIATNANQSSNLFDHNYWLRHDNIDLDHDGIADLAYQPTNFSSYLLEKYNISILLIGTPILRFLDWLERLFPSLSPISLKDQHPIMKGK